MALRERVDLFTDAAMKSLRLFIYAPISVLFIIPLVVIAYVIAAHIWTLMTLIKLVTLGRVGVGSLGDIMFDLKEAANHVWWWNYKNLISHLPTNYETFSLLP